MRFRRETRGRHGGGGGVLREWRLVSSKCGQGTFPLGDLHAIVLQLFALHENTIVQCCQTLGKHANLTSTQTTTTLTAC